VWVRGGIGSKKPTAKWQEKYLASILYSCKSTSVFPRGQNTDDAIDFADFAAQAQEPAAADSPAPYLQKICYK
jgi:hypothetical protein